MNRNLQSLIPLKNTLLKASKIPETGGKGAEKRTGRDCQITRVGLTCHLTHAVRLMQDEI